MLFVLTGKIQIGKTRWLQRLVEETERRGGRCDGVIAPGDWRRIDGMEGEARFEKLGIFNELLPGHERISFAVKRSVTGDLPEAVRERTKSKGRGPNPMLGWDFRAASIEKVNEWFSRLPCCDVDAGVLIVDEIGRLELSFGEGLTSAMDVLKAGPTPSHPVALVVVREDLLELARGSFSDAWGGFAEIAPDETSFLRVMRELERAGIVAPALPPDAQA